MRQPLQTIEVLEPGLLTTVQDMGRHGYQRYGVPVSGSMDQFALRAANLLVGNHAGAAGLEITLIGPRLRFLADTVIAVTGADLAPVLAKIDEELAEVTAEIELNPRDPDRLEDEIGDLLFVVANLARHLAIDPETALRQTNAKFERRFRAIEAEYAAQDKDPAEATLDQLDAAWNRAKAAEKVS